LYKAPDAQGQQRISSEFSLTEIVQLPDAAEGQVWLPIKAQWITNSGDYSTRATVEGDLGTIRINDAVRDQDFHVPFPRDTKVHDRKSGMDFVQSASTELTDPTWTTENVALAPVRPVGEMVVAAPVKSTTEAQSARRWVILVALLFVAGVASYVAWRRFRRQAQS
jgi:hypothetical protein